MASRDDPVDGLFVVPPAEFTAARNRLVRSLKASGDDGRARVVQAFRKPTAAIWAMNQAARQHRKDARAVAAAARSLSKAQHAALTAKGRTVLDTAAADARDAEATFAAHARAAADQAGVRLASSATDVIRDTLRALATAGEETVDAFMAGRLTGALDPAPLEEVLATMRPGKRRTRRRRDERPRARAEQRRLEREERAARARARAARREADQLQRAATRAERLLEAARGRARAAEERAAVSERGLNANGRGIRRRRRSARSRR